MLMDNDCLVDKIYIDGKDDDILEIFDHLQYNFQVYIHVHQKVVYCC